MCRNTIRRFGWWSFLSFAEHISVIVDDGWRWWRCGRHEWLYNWVSTPCARVEEELLDCVDGRVSWLHEAERGKVDDQFFAVVGLERFLQFEVILSSDNFFFVAYLEYLMKQSSHISFILPTQISCNPFNNLKRYLWSFHLASRLQIEQKLEEVVYQVDIEHILPKDPIIKKGFETFQCSWKDIRVDLEHQWNNCRWAEL